MLISPKIWRSVFKPRLKEIISEVRRKDVFFFLHSDGNIEELIPDIIKIGINILNPIQPECMNPEEIKRRYGQRLVLHGTMSMQKTFALGTLIDVIDEVKSRIEKCGQDGGLILAPSNLFTEDIPIENIIGFYDFVKSFKLY